jgi:hypothetical protein
MGAHGAIRWPARSPDLNPLDIFIFIGNFRDNVYLTPPGTQKELKKMVVRVCQEKPRNFLLNAKVDEGIDSACNSIEEILSNQNRFCIVYKFDYLIFDFQFFPIKIHFLFFLLMYEYSEEDSL